MSTSLVVAIRKFIQGGLFQVDLEHSHAGTNEESVKTLENTCMTENPLLELIRRPTCG
jgi:hypothetical protein